MLSLSKERIAQIAEIVRRKEIVGIEGKERLVDKLENIFVKTIVTRIYRTSKNSGIKRYINCFK